MDEIKINQLIRSNRKTVSITITKKAEIIVRAPSHICDRVINEIVRKKSSWINKKLATFKPANEKKFTNGEFFLFLGKEYCLINDEQSDLPDIHMNIPRIEGTDIVIHSPLPSETKEVMISWYKKQAASIIPERCFFISKKTGITFSTIKISDAKKRWGSCGLRGSLNFAWRLVMCPMEIIDYVIIHELVHIEIRNHSRMFWKKVESFMPDYREKDLWLKNNSYKICF